MGHEDKRKSPYPLDANSYRLLYEIGSGVSAVVFKAACLPLNSSPVAIKSIDLEQSRANLDDVRREAKAMALLSHPNVLRAHCSFTVDSHLWVVMPFMAAGSLHSIISHSYPTGLPEPSIAIILKDILHALSYLHGQGHIHRDIKAGNILIDTDGSVKLADFGVSASIYESQHLPSLSSSSFFNDMAGTPYWMAPEVIHSHIGYGIKADIWSFGITALELAHGRPPLSHLPLSKSLMMRITSRLRLEDTPDKSSKEKKTKRKKFSKAFKDMVASCLSRDPSKRPSADKLLRHPFFRNCKSNDYLVKNMIQAVPSLEKRLEERVIDDRIDEGGGDSSPAVKKSRRVSGWNFNEDVLELDPVYPTDVPFGHEGKEEGNDEEPKEEEEDKEASCEGSRPSSSVLKESLVPDLVYLLGSLDVQRGMVMNVLAYCGGGEGSDRDGCCRDQLLGFVRSLQQTVDELRVQLQGEMSKNALLEEALETLRRKKMVEE